MRGALDFSKMRRYRVTDRLRKRLVYAELDRETELAVYRAAYQKLSWFIPVAENRRDVAKSAHDTYSRYIDALVERGHAATQTDYRALWENYWGINMDSDEWREEERRILLDHEMRRKARGTAK